MVVQEHEIKWKKNISFRFSKRAKFGYNFIVEEVNDRLIYVGQLGGTF